MPTVQQLYNSTNICCPFSFSFMAGRLFFLATAMRRHSKEWKALACAHARGMVATAHNYMVAGDDCVPVAQPVLCDFGVRLGFPKVVHHSIRGNSTPSCVAQGTQTHWLSTMDHFDQFISTFLLLPSWMDGFIVYLFPYQSKCYIGQTSSGNIKTILQCLGENGKVKLHEGREGLLP